MPAARAGAARRSRHRRHHHRMGQHEHDAAHADAPGAQKKNTQIPTSRMQRPRYTHILHRTWSDTDCATPRTAATCSLVPRPPLSLPLSLPTHILLRLQPEALRPYHWSCESPDVQDKAAPPSAALQPHRILANTAVAHGEVLLLCRPVGENHSIVT